jgi:ABC-2 type transport system ATP-binding protein
VSKKRIPELLKLVDLTEHKDKKLRTFSKGMLQRIGLAQALLNDPALVFLDEPTSGLDPMGRRLVRDIIHSLQDRGTTIFLNSHFLSEVEITCDRVAFIKKGVIIYESAMAVLVKGEIAVCIRAKLRERVQGRRVDWASVVAGLCQWGTILHTEGETITLTVKDTSAIPHINRYLVAQDVDVFSITPQRVSLEDLFMQIIESG